MEFSEVIRKRQATRKFSDKEIEKEKIESILEAGRIAPTAKNIQPIKIYVAESKNSLESIDKASPCRYNAPIVLIICGDKDKAFSKDNHSTYEIDASIVTTHMMLEATNQDIDNIWVDLFDREIISEEFLIPSNLIPVALLPIGYKEKDAPNSPMHNIRKNLNEIVEYK